MGKSHSKYLKSSRPPNHQPKAGPSSWKNEIHHSQPATNQECPIQKGHRGSKHDETIMENDDMSITHRTLRWLFPEICCNMPSSESNASTASTASTSKNLTTAVCPRKNSSCTLQDMSISHCFAPWRNTDKKKNWLLPTKTWERNAHSLQFPDSAR